MKTQSPDTPPHIEKILIEGYRRMTLAERFHRVEELNRSLETLMCADIRRRHPNADETEVRLRLASRRIPPELMLRAFGWDVREKGY